MTIGTLYIISAPSGAGKTSLTNALLDITENLEVSTSHTTRGIRKGEENGKHYHFVSKTSFEEGIRENLFLEYANVFGNYYGTSQDAINETLSAGTDVILEIDWQGAQQVRQIIPEVRSIFILPPSVSELESRLKSRNQDSDDVISHRVSQAKEDITHYVEYDHIIINDDFEIALKDLKSIFRSQRTQTSKIQQRKSDFFTRLLA
ncbi:UNVERIFIED_CONTAM: hypothetical protein GTU68_014676 [Idotea baltica]|nr:hypothetical protein [Idotea baltica]